MDSDTQVSPDRTIPGSGHTLLISGSLKGIAHQKSIVINSLPGADGNRFSWSEDMSRKAPGKV